MNFVKVVMHALGFHSWEFDSWAAGRGYIEACTQCTTTRIKRTGAPKGIR